MNKSLLSETVHVQTANREASITKRQRDEYMSLLAAESARLVQVQQELQTVNLTTQMY